MNKHLSISRRFLSVLTFFPAYVVLGCVAGFAGMLLVGFIATKIALLQQMIEIIPPFVNVFLFIVFGSAYASISLVDIIFQQARVRGDRVVLSVIVTGMFWLAGVLWGL